MSNANGDVTVSDVDFTAENFIIPIGEFAGERLLFNDPLLRLQSFITGFSVSSDGITLEPNAHINLLPVWEEYSGRNIAIASGELFDPDHIELQNVEISSILDFELNGPRPHGSSTLGIINAVANNGIGLTGIAHGSDVNGVANSSRISSDDFDIFTSSSGGGIFFLLRNPQTFRELYNGNNGPSLGSIYNAENVRDGLGIINVKSAGNTRQYDGSTQSLSPIHEIMLVAAADLTLGGSIAWYSNQGAALHVSGLIGSLLSDEHIITTDVAGDPGYVASVGEGERPDFGPQSDYQSVFANTFPDLNTGDYTYFSGTSAASPVVSAVAALVLEASGNNIHGKALGWRDVQEIFAISARHIGSEIGASDLVGYEDNPWFVNGAQNINGGGFHVSSDYGFGLVDAHGAVRLAETWAHTRTSHNLVTQTEILINSDEARSFSFGNSLTFTVNASEDTLELDVLELMLSFEHEFHQELKITVVSPNGTTSLLLDTIGLEVSAEQLLEMRNNRDPLEYGGVREGYQLLTRQFWGEETAGVWTITIEDMVDNGNQGTITALDIVWKGDLASEDDTYYFTDDWALMNEANDGVPTINDSVGQNSLNLAAVSDAVSLSLVAGASSHIGGDTAFRLGASTAVALAITGDGDDVLVGTAAGETLVGMRGDDVLRGGDGNDLLSAGSGNDAIWAGAGDTGDDTLFGGTGDDVLAGGAGDDFIVGGDANGAGLMAMDLGEQAGFDTLYGGAGNDTLIAGSADEGVALTTGGARNTLYAGTGDDLVIGDGGGDILGGGAGADQLEGQGGHDTLYGGAGAGMDTLAGGTGNDRIFAGGGADFIEGGSGNDLLFNGAGNDTVLGGEGNDTLWGGGGNDTLTGGAGPDTFIFAANNGNDTITDFDVDDDTLDLTDPGIADQGITDFASLTARASDLNGDVQIKLDTTTILLTGLSLDDLTESNFLFA